MRGDVLRMSCSQHWYKKTHSFASRASLVGWSGRPIAKAPLQMLWMRAFNQGVAGVMLNQE